MTAAGLRQQQEISAKIWQCLWADGACKNWAAIHLGLCASRADVFQACWHVDLFCYALSKGTACGSSDTAEFGAEGKEQKLHYLSFIIFHNVLQSKHQLYYIRVIQSILFAIWRKGNSIPE